MRSSLVGALALTLAFLSDDAAHAAPGDPDTSFSGDGQLIVDFADGREEGHGVAVAGNGAIVVVGGYTHSGSGQSDDFALVRVNPGGAVQSRTADINDGDETAFGVAMLGTGGTIVATGFTRPSGPDQHFAVVRFKPDLQLDPTFNGTGTGFVDFGSHSLSKAVAIDSQLNMVAVGTAEVGGGEDDFALTRLEPEDGALDMGFSGDGKQVTDLGGADQANAVAIDASGRIVVAGSAGPAFGTDFAVARYRALDGSLDDPGFSPDGWRKTDFGSGSDVATAVAIQPDGKIVVAGTDLSDFLLARYNPDGTLDASFSGDGKQRTSFTASSDIANAVAVQPDGRILVAGRSFTGASNDFALARYNPNGSLDPTFSGDGRQTADLGSNDVAEGMALQSDGKIVVAGTQGTAGVDGTFAIARFEGGGAPPDTDGDGVPDAGDACPTVAAATANGCPPAAPVDPFPLPPIPLPTPPSAPGVTATGTAGPDVFAGTVGRDVFHAGAGNDRLRGGPAGDLLCGEAGNDQVDGEAGSDQLFGDFCPGAKLAALAGAA